MKVKKGNPEIVLIDGKPAAVIIDIDEYREMLERLEDVDDLTMLEEMRRKPLKFKRLQNFLNEYTQNDPTSSPRLAAIQGRYKEKPCA